MAEALARENNTSGAYLISLRRPGRSVFAIREPVGHVDRSSVAIASRYRIFRRRATLVAGSGRGEKHKEQEATMDEYEPGSIRTYLMQMGDIRC